MKLLNSCCGNPTLEETDSIPGEEAVMRQALFLKSLADPARIRIVYALKNRELCACEIMALLKMPQAMVSHHCKILKIAGIIADRKSGRWVHYSLVEPGALEILKAINNK
ncbi:MAG TPA: metalloregulator ArsR/SmtB family transcription factor [Methanocella sp.]|nr:metalloregulator ArsR/SmtB family transcription factor [Methanocella sp.]